MRYRGAQRGARPSCKGRRRNQDVTSNSRFPMTISYFGTDESALHGRARAALVEGGSRLLLELAEQARRLRVLRVDRERLLEARDRCRVVLLRLLRLRERDVAARGLREELQVHVQELDRLVGPVLDQRRRGRDETGLAEVIGLRAVVLRLELVVLRRRGR